MLECAFFPKQADEEQGDDGNQKKDHGSPAGAVAQTEGDALIVNANPMKPVRNDHPWHIIGAKATQWRLGKMPYRPCLRRLIEEVKRQGEEEEQAGQGHKF